MDNLSVSPTSSPAGSLGPTSPSNGGAEFSEMMSSDQQLGPSGGDQPPVMEQGYGDPAMPGSRVNTPEQPSSLEGRAPFDTDDASEIAQPPVTEQGDDDPVILGSRVNAPEQASALDGQVTFDSLYTSNPEFKSRVDAMIGRDGGAKLTATDLLDASLGLGSDVAAPPPPGNPATGGTPASGVGPDGLPEQAESLDGEVKFHAADEAEAEALKRNFDGLYESDPQFKELADGLIGRDGEIVLTVKELGGGVAGLGTIGGPGTAIDHSAVSTGNTLAHELLHNEGVEHGQEMERRAAGASDMA